MKHAKFRAKLSPRETLAIDPRALDTEFNVQTPKENVEPEPQIAVVSICGPLEHHPSYMWDSYDSILQRIERALASEEAGCVVLCIDSPGGDAAGATEAHRSIQRLKKKYGKKIYAYSNESMYSAAYAIGSAADEIWVPDTGGVGSVGVICALLDKTKQNEMLGLNIKLLTTGARKADSHADRELTDEVVSSMQSRVDYLGDIFFRQVAKARGMSPKDVQALEAGVFMGQDAVDAGLADAVGGWYKFLQYVGAELQVEPTSNPDLSSDNTESAKEHAQMTLADLKKAKDLAAKKLASAKSSERNGLFKAYEKAATMLADFAAKTKYVKKTEEKLEKDDDDDEDDDSEDDDDTEESEDDDSESESEESEESEEESEEEEESSSKQKASKKAKKAAASASLKDVENLFQACVRITGKTDTSEMLGALEGLAPRVRNMPKIERRLARIEDDSRKTRVKSMLDAAVKDGRVTPHQAKGLEPQGMKDPKWLKGFLSTQPKLMRSQEEEMVPNIGAPSQTLDMQGLSADQQKMLQQAAQSAGMSVEDYTKEIDKQSKAHTNVNQVNGAAVRKLF